MSNDTSVNAASAGTSVATQIAMLAVESEQADYEAQSAIRESELTSKREHDKDQIADIRDKAGKLLVDGLVTGGLMMASSAMQVGAANARYDANKANSDLNHPTAETAPPDELASTVVSSNATADLFKAASTFLDGSARTSDLAFNSAVTNKDADAASDGNLSDEAKARADDANAARLRALSQLDGKLAIAQDLLRSEADTMHLLIRPA
jgi:hypothetical protein